MSEQTTIRISKGTRNELAKLGSKSETYDAIILKLIRKEGSLEAKT